MDKDLLTSEQLALVNASFDSKITAVGYAGTGKTTAASFRLLHMIQSGIPAEEILVLVPQRTLANTYQQILTQPEFPAGGAVTIQTFGGLAQRMVELFWPLVARTAGFQHPESPPIFLTLESAQYYMARVIKRLLDEQRMEVIPIEKNRLYSQILDNLNKAASIGIPHTSIGEKLANAWVGKPSQLLLYELAQKGAELFRIYCLQNNLLDFSLQIETFGKCFPDSFLARSYLFSRFQHLIYDNVEEDIPISHDFVKTWLPNLRSAIMIFDKDGGYRSFLGADPVSAQTLVDSSTKQYYFNHSFITNDAIEGLRVSLSEGITRSDRSPLDGSIRKAFSRLKSRFLPDMFITVADSVADEIQKGTSPSEIALLTPYLSDSLRFSLINELDKRHVSVWTHRPSRSLREEPAAQCLLTLAKLGYPHWGLKPDPFQIRLAFQLSIQQLDFPRAELLTRIIYRPNSPEYLLGDFSIIKTDVQNRITFTVGEKYSFLKQWLYDFSENNNVPLDVFFSRIFGEVLSQPGFGFSNDYSSAAIVSRIIESARKFRHAIPMPSGPSEIGKEYIEMVEAGVLAAQYFRPWEVIPSNAILLLPAYTFLMRNQSVAVQYWLDVSSSGWWERLNQPLTHPFVLSRNWTTGRLWTHSDEIESNQRTLQILTSGLLRRCSEKVYFCSTGMNQSGREEIGPLLLAIQSILKRLPAEDVIH